MLRLSLLVLVLFSLTIIASCGNDSTQAKESDQANEQEPKAKVEKQEPAKDIISFTAYDLNGTLRNSSEWIGKQPTVVNIWGTWCPPCRREIPDLVRLYDEYNGKGVEILGLAVERGSTDKVAGFAKSNGMEWVMLIGTVDHLKLYETGSVPTTIFYDRTGSEVTRMIGLHSYADFKEAFDEIIKN